MAYLLVRKGIKVSHYHCVGVYIYVFRSFRVCLMKLGALTLGAYRLIIVITFWCISPFISMECPLSHLMNVSLKSTLSKVSIATPACFYRPLAWQIFFQPFTLSQCLFLSMRWVSCRQQIVASSFLIWFGVLEASCT
jgi:hypothetical protein